MTEKEARRWRPQGRLRNRHECDADLDRFHREELCWTLVGFLFVRASKGYAYARVLWYSLPKPYGAEMSNQEIAKVEGWDGTKVADHLSQARKIVRQFFRRE